MAEGQVVPQQAQPQAGTAQGGGWLTSVLYFVAPMLMYALLEKAISAIWGGQSEPEMPVGALPELEQPQQAYSPGRQELVAALMKPAEPPAPLYGTLYGRLYDQRGEMEA